MRRPSPASASARICLRPDIGLATHVDDVVGVFEFEDLRDVVLVAHSYGGMPVAGAMQRISDRVSTVVWLDAHMPRAGESIFDLIGPERTERMMAMAAAHGEGWFIPTSDASWWGLTDPGQIAWVNSKTTPQPLKTYTDKSGPTDRAWTTGGWLDAHKPQAGESIFDLIGPERAERMMAMAAADGEGWFIPTSDASWWGLTDPDQIAWVNSKTTPQPLKTYTDKSGPTDRAWAHPGTAIECNPTRLPERDLARQRARAETDACFQHRKLDSCHEPMITEPDQLTRLLIEAAAGVQRCPGRRQRRCAPYLLDAGLLRSTQSALTASKRSISAGSCPVTTHVFGWAARWRRSSYASSMASRSV